MQSFYAIDMQKQCALVQKDSHREGDSLIYRKPVYNGVEFLTLHQLQRSVLSQLSHGYPLLHPVLYSVISVAVIQSTVYESRLEYYPICLRFVNDKLVHLSASVCSRTRHNLDGFHKLNY